METVLIPTINVADHGHRAGVAQNIEQIVAVTNDLDPEVEKFTDTSNLPNRVVRVADDRHQWPSTVVNDALEAKVLGRVERSDHVHGVVCPFCELPRLWPGERSQHVNLARNVEVAEQVVPRLLLAFLRELP
jgi:hypothetical protein